MKLFVVQAELDYAEYGIILITESKERAVQICKEANALKRFDSVYIDEYEMDEVYCEM